MPRDSTISITAAVLVLERDFRKPTRNSLLVLNVAARLGNCAPSPRFCKSCKGVGTTGRVCPPPSNKAKKEKAIVRERDLLREICFAGVCYPPLVEGRPSATRCVAYFRMMSIPCSPP